MVKHNQGSQLPEQNMEQTNFFFSFQHIVVQDWHNLVIIGIHVGFSSECASGQWHRGLPEEPLISILLRQAWTDQKRDFFAEIDF